MVVGARPHTPGQGTPRPPLEGIRSYPEGIRSRSLKRGITIGGEGNDGISFLPPLPTPQWTCRARNQPSPPLYIVGRRMGALPKFWRSPLPPQHLLLLRSAWRSPAGELQAPPPRRRAAGALPQLLLSPCWIKKEETSPGCTCVERGGTVVWCLDRIRPRSESLSERLHRPRSCNASA